MEPIFNLGCHQLDISPSTANDQIVVASERAIVKDRSNTQVNKESLCSTSLLRPRSTIDRIHFGRNRPSGHKHGTGGKTINEAHSQHQPVVEFAHGVGHSNHIVGNVETPEKRKKGGEFRNDCKGSLEGKGSFIEPNWHRLGLNC